MTLKHPFVFYHLENQILVIKVKLINEINLRKKNFVKLVKAPPDVQQNNQHKEFYVNSFYFANKQQ